MGYPFLNPSIRRRASLLSHVDVTAIARELGYKTPVRICRSLYVCCDVRRVLFLGACAVHRADRLAKHATFRVAHEGVIVIARVRFDAKGWLLVEAMRRGAALNARASKAACINIQDLV